MGHVVIIIREGITDRRMLNHCIISSSTCRRGRARAKGLAAHRSWFDNRNIFSWPPNAPSTSSQTSSLRQWDNRCSGTCVAFYLFYSFLFNLYLLGVGESHNRVPDNKWPLPGRHYAGWDRQGGDCSGEFYEIVWKCGKRSYPRYGARDKRVMEKLKVIDFWDFKVVDESPSFHVWIVKNSFQKYFQFSSPPGGCKPGDSSWQNVNSSIQGGIWGNKRFPFV